MDRPCDRGITRMSFVSYAQNFEDVMLRRALKHVEKGFYIDVGAWSPDLDSVTRAFYDMGWRGINIEPNPEFHGQLCTRRQRDINLSLAVSDSKAVLTMNFLSNPGLSTLDDHIAIKHVESGLVVVRRDVQVTTLSALWREHVPTDQEVHFLKVDVEGAEKAVLEGNDWQRCRPWIVVVEATLPMEQTDSYETWEPILLAAQYNFVYADGLNRYYVASERPGLMSSFVHPPNVFDDFVLRAQREAEVLAEQSQARAREAEALAQQANVRMDAAEAQMQEQRQRAEAAEAHSQTLQMRLDELGHSNHHWWMQANQLEAERDALRQSLSWRITAPLRFAAGVVLRPGFALRTSANRALYRAIEVGQRPLARLMAVVLRKPFLAQQINTWLMRFPPLYQHLLSVAQRQGVVPGLPLQVASHRAAKPVHETPAPDLAHLTPRARQIYADLKQAIENNKRVG